MLLEADFPYPVFALLLFINGVSSGLFSAPNGTQIRHAVPVTERGQASGLRATTMNAGQLMSIGVFFTLIAFSISLVLYLLAASPSGWADPRASRKRRKNGRWN